MALTGNELTFECEGCERENFPEQMAVVDGENLCPKCRHEKAWEDFLAWQSNTFSPSTLATKTTGSATSSTTLKPKQQTPKS